MESLEEIEADFTQVHGREFRIWLDVGNFGTDIIIQDEDERAKGEYQICQGIPHDDVKNAWSYVRDSFLFFYPDYKINETQAKEISKNILITARK